MFIVAGRWSVQSERSRMEFKNLRSLSAQEQKEFLDSFDMVLLDCDGKWLINVPPINWKKKITVII